LTKRFKNSRLEKHRWRKTVLYSLSSCLTTLWTQLAYRFNWRTARPFPPTSAGGCDAHNHVLLHV